VTRPARPTRGRRAARREPAAAPDPAPARTHSTQRRQSARAKTADDGRVVITHPDKLLFPDDGITKGELADYYARVASIMVPHIRNRPVTMERFPEGIGREGFLQKNVSRGFPAWLPRVTMKKKGGVVHHATVTDARSLAWIANQNCITPHVGTSRAPHLDRPDICVFDLDPSRDDLESLVSAALALRDLLGARGLTSYVKTSGSKGYHIVVPLDGKATSGRVSAFAHDVAQQLVARDPGRLTMAFAKADRGGRIYVDAGRNGYGATFAAVYAVRARRGAPVSAPCTWDEVASGAAAPQAFTLRSMASRLDAVGDLWRPLGSGLYS
jgi:bifunctional non-homologous end joining protein LigD